MILLLQVPNTALSAMYECSRSLWGRLLSRLLAALVVKGVLEGGIAVL